MQELRFTVVGISPRQGAVSSFAINESQIGIDSVPKINSVGKIFPGCKDESLQAEESRIDIDLSFTVAREAYFNFIGSKFYIGQRSGCNEVKKASCLSADCLPHFFIIIGCIEERGGGG